MPENQTKPTEISAETYLAAIADESRRKDCEALSKLIARLSKQPPVMWGPAIVGFGTHAYELSGGREGKICAVGFSSRKADITIYGAAGEKADPALLARLGKHKRGKGCLYISRLGDVDLKVLEKLIANALKVRASKNA